MLTIGSLFSGIGGLELGLEMAGLGPVKWQCEVDPFCREVLAKHWPEVLRFEDVTRPRDYPDVDLLCGGFPCQDVSSAGARRGLGGPKSSLWWHYADVIRKVGPRFVVVENVASGARLWLPHVRHQLHVLGYRTRALAISAADVGAPHLRRRIFVVAHSRGEQLREQPRRGSGARRQGTSLTSVARKDGGPHGDADRDGESAFAEHGEVAGVRSLASRASPWAAPPEFRGVDDGVSCRVDRLRALGNAVVPQCAEAIGRVIVGMLAESEGEKR
jgi:DNA (cytosine-5)-methyltransferase 1